MRVYRGYVNVKQPEHPRAGKGGYIREHVAIIEKALGKHLPCGSIPHHVDGNKHNNANTNLVLCQDVRYHMLLHIRTKALKECGNANFRKCMYCKSYDHPNNMRMHLGGQSISETYVHRACEAKRKRDYTLKNPGKTARQRRIRAALAQRPEPQGPYVRMVRPKTGRTQ